jgi:hypothetical protein
MQWQYQGIDNSEGINFSMSAVIANSGFGQGVIGR